MPSPKQLVDLAEIAGIDDLPQSVMMIIARRLIAASSASSRLSSEALNDELDQLFKKLWSNLPGKARAAIRDSGPESSGIKQAFAAGQVSFAHAVAGQMSELRQSDDFQMTVTGQRYAKYIEALEDGDRSGVELRALVGVADDATVSRRLAELRELGITDFRKDGRSTINFLTPAARDVYEKSLREKSESGAARVHIRDPQSVSVSAASKRQVLVHLQNSVGSHLQRAQHVVSDANYA